MDVSYGRHPVARAVELSLFVAGMIVWIVVRAIGYLIAIALHFIMAVITMWYTLFGALLVMLARFCEGDKRKVKLNLKWE